MSENALFESTSIGRPSTVDRRGAVDDTGTKNNHNQMEKVGKFLEIKREFEKF